MEKYKMVNGCKLHWAKDLQAYELPLPQPGKVRMVLDDKTNSLKAYNAGDMAYRERSANFPDGTQIHETVVFAPPTDIDLEAARLRIEQKQLELMESAVDGLLKLRPLVALGVAASVIAFFASVTIALYSLGDIVAVRVNMAMAEVAHYGVYTVALLLLSAVLRYGLPLLLGFKVNATSAEREEADACTRTGDVFINVQQSGNGGTAQDIINKRALI